MAVCFLLVLHVRARATHTHTYTYTHTQEWVTLRPISRVSVLGKSVLPRVLVRVTLLLPAHLPVLIGQRVSHSGGCRLVLGVSVCPARANTHTTTHLHQPVSLTLLLSWWLLTCTYSTKSQPSGKKKCKCNWSVWCSARNNTNIHQPLTVKIPI